MKKNIIHITEKFWPHNGGSTYRLLNLLKGVNQDNYNIIVLCENSENFSKEDSLDNIKIIRFNSYWEIPLLLFKLKKQFGRLDILHSHNFRPSFFALFFKRLFSNKSLFINELHAIYKVSNEIKQYIGNYITRKSDIVIVLSQSSKAYLIHKVGIKENKIEVIYNGIDINKFSKVKIEKLLPKTIDFFLSRNILTVAYIGSLHDFQGIDNFIDIANSVVKVREDIQFLLVGGEEIQILELKRKVKDTNRILLHKSIDSKCIPILYKKIDVLLIPRPKMLATETAVPLKPIEAIAAGKLVLGTNVGGLRELKNKVDNKKQMVLYNTINEIVEFLIIENNFLSTENVVDLHDFDMKNQSRKLMNIYSTYIK